MAANGLKKGDYTTLPAGVAAARFAALKAGVVDAAVVLPPLNFQADEGGLRHARLCRGLRERPAVHRHGGAPALGRRKPVGRQARPCGNRQERRLARGPRRIASEAVELLVKVARSSKEDAEASYDYLKRIEYFEPSSKISRKKLRNLVDDGAARRDRRPGFDIDRLAMPGLTELVD